MEKKHDTEREERGRTESILKILLNIQLKKKKIHTYIHMTMFQSLKGTLKGSIMNLS